MANRFERLCADSHPRQLSLNPAAGGILSIVAMGFLSASTHGVEPPALGGGPRYPSIDIARGLIMIVMALDHASVAWNQGRAMPEVVGFGPIDYGHWTQQFTRELTHICAPGFQLLAGMGLAISVWRRQLAGKSELAVSADMVLRGLVLLFCDFVLMYYAYDRVPFFFLVLACIGSCTILFAIVRKLPPALILVFGAAVILCGPVYAKGRVVAPTAAEYLVNVFTNVALPTQWPAPPGQTGFFVLYPIFPWIGCFAVGWFLGTMYERSAARHRGEQESPRRPLVEAGHAERRCMRTPVPLGSAGLALIVAAILLRWLGGPYADPHPMGGGPSSAAFWTLSKYPPSPVFLLATTGMMFVMLGALRTLDVRARLSGIWRVPLVFGQVSLFFFVVHMYLYFAYPFTSGTAKTYSLATTYIVWLAGLVVLFPLCLLYRELRSRHRRLLRYF